MKYILEKDIKLGIIFVLLGIAGLVIGISKWPFLVLGAIFILSYIRLDKKRLRCPNCGGFENLERLVSAKKVNCYCRHCGQKINIS